MQIKIAITGPESSGKTTLANSLGDFYNCPVVKEVSRDYLKKKQTYNYTDLLEIAKQQKKLELKLTKKNKLIICDTTLQIIKIWSIEKFKKCHPWILSQPDDYIHYFLCKPDIPWVSDPLRENPFDRNRLFKLYLEDLTGKPFTIISGEEFERNLTARKIINRYLNS